jgi:AcrR family transcriptional regulator
MPKIVDHQQYRQQLLSQCFALFAKHGYGSITMRAIAQGLGVSTGTLYHYFNSKEQLFEQLIDYLSLQDTNEAALANVSHPPDLADRIRVVMECVANEEEYCRQQDLLLAEFYRHQTPEVARQNAVTMAADERYVQALARYLGIDDRPMLDFFLAWISGLLYRRMLMGDRVSMAEQTELIAAMISAYWERTDRGSKSLEWTGAGDRGRSIDR